MTTETESVDRRSAIDRDVVAAIDEVDGEPRFIVADIARDDAWISVTETDATALEQWR